MGDTGPLEGIEDVGDLTVIEAPVGAEDDAESAVLTLLVPSRSQELIGLDGLSVEPQGPIGLQGHDVLGRRLDLGGRSPRQLDAEAVQIDHGQGGHHEEDQQKEHDVDHGDDHNRRLFKIANITEAHGHCPAFTGIVSNAEKHISISVMMRSRRWVK